MKTFEVDLKDGTRLNFDKQCNQVEIFEKVIYFKYIFDNSYSILAIIPIENIDYIVNHE